MVVLGAIFSGIATVTEAAELGLVVTVAGAMTLHWPQWAVLFLVDLFIFVVGIFLHGAANIIILGPLFLPLMTSIGVHPLHYGMMFIMGQAVGQQTFGNVLLAVASVTRIPIEEILPSLSLFIVAFIAAWLMVTYIPALSLTIPHSFGAH